MPRTKDPNAKNKDTPRTLNRAEMERRMEDFADPCPGCGAEVPRRRMIPYGGSALCSACFLGATGAARDEARKAAVPLFMRARVYATMAYGWRKRPCDCGG